MPECEREAARRYCLRQNHVATQSRRPLLLLSSSAQFVGVSNRVRRGETALYWTGAPFAFLGECERRTRPLNGNRILGALAVHASATHLLSIHHGAPEPTFPSPKEQPRPLSKLGSSVYTGSTLPVLTGLDQIPSRHRALSFLFLHSGSVAWPGGAIFAFFAITFDVALPFPHPQSRRSPINNRPLVSGTGQRAPVAQHPLRPLS